MPTIATQQQGRGHRAYAYTHDLSLTQATGTGTHEHTRTHTAEREGKARDNGEMGAPDTHQIAGTAKQARGGRENTSVKAGARL